MTPAEKKKAFEAARRAVLRKSTAIKRDAAAEIIRLLKLAQSRIKLTLASQPSDYQRWQLPSLQSSIERTLAQFQGAAARTGTAAQTTAFDAGVDLIDGPLSAAGVQIAGTVPGIDRRQLEAMKSFMTDRIKGMTGAAIDKINTDLGLVILGVQSPGEAIGNVARILGDPARERAITIVRTEVGRAFSSASFERMNAAAERLPALKRIWRRSGKLHSRPEHDALDGQVREVDEPFQVVDSRTGEIVELMYPRDPAAPLSQTINCGCEALPFVESWGIAPAPVPFAERELLPAELQRNPVKAAFAARQGK